MKTAIILLIKFYQSSISPFLGRHCRFRPTCSEYTRQAVNKLGLVKGLWVGLKRLLKCHPLGGSGYDPLRRSQQDKNDLGPGKKID